MQTKATLVAHLTRIVQDASYNGLHPELINKARKEIAGRVFIPALRSTATIATIPESNASPMPDDYQHELFSCYNTTESRRIPVLKSMNLMASRIPHDIDKDGTLFAVVVEPVKTPQASIGTLTLAGLPVADETFLIGSQTFTFKVVRAGTGEVTIGATAALTADNIVTAIATDIPLVATATAASGVVTITTVAKTAAANETAFSGSPTNATLDGDGYLGGTQPGCKTAWLRYARSPSEANSLDIKYFSLPTDLSDDTDVPTEIPEHLQYDLIVRSVVYECFEEIYSEDKPTIPDRWLRRREISVEQLRLFLGPYAKEPEQVHDDMDWDGLVECT